MKSSLQNAAAAAGAYNHNNHHNNIHNHIDVDESIESVSFDSPLVFNEVDVDEELSCSFFPTSIQNNIGANPLINEAHHNQNHHNPHNNNNHNNNHNNHNQINNKQATEEDNPFVAFNRRELALLEQLHEAQDVHANNDDDNDDNDNNNDNNDNSNLYGDPYRSTINKLVVNLHSQAVELRACKLYLNHAKRQIKSLSEAESRSSTERNQLLYSLAAAEQDKLLLDTRIKELVTFKGMNETTMSIEDVRGNLINVSNKVSTDASLQ
jgi:hypothetical protein